VKNSSIAMVIVGVAVTLWTRRLQCVGHQPTVAA
jgi:hypothetical protein